MPIFLYVQLDKKSSGTKAELKNLNSFNYVRRGLEHEEIRQEKVLLSGGLIEQETRRFDESTGETISNACKRRISTTTATSQSLTY